MSRQRLGSAESFSKKKNLGNVSRFVVARFFFVVTSPPRISKGRTPGPVTSELASIIIDRCNCHLSQPCHQKKKYDLRFTYRRKSTQEIKFRFQKVDVVEGSSFLVSRECSNKYMCKPCICKEYFECTASTTRKHWNWNEG